MTIFFNTHETMEKVQKRKKPKATKKKEKLKLATTSISTKLNTFQFS